MLGCCVGAASTSSFAFTALSHADAKFCSGVPVVGVARVITAIACSSLSVIDSCTPSAVCVFVQPLGAA